jgi:hypothetical protein
MSDYNICAPSSMSDYNICCDSSMSDYNICCDDSSMSDYNICDDTSCTDDGGSFGGTFTDYTSYMSDYNIWDATSMSDYSIGDSSFDFGESCLPTAAKSLRCLLLIGARSYEG